MLKFLHIENIAVIEQSDIEFTSGFNVLTGETGAGKSIVIDSLNAVLGQRTSKDLIRAGCDSAEVSAVFGDFPEKTVNHLKEFDIFPDEDGNIVITRKLSVSGKGLIKINGKPVTAATLKEISVFLVDIHGQHDNQALLNPQMHCSFLDAVAENEHLKKEYYNEFRELNRIRKELNELETDAEEKERKIGILKYQINEIESADLKVGEFDSLKQKLSVAEEAENIIKNLNAINTLLNGSDDKDGSLSNLRLSLKHLANLKVERFEKAYSGLQDALSVFEDLASDVSDYLLSDELNDLNIDNINQRLDSISRLMLKYGNSEAEILNFLSNAKEELEKIEFSDKRILELEDLLEISKEKLISKAELLTKSRLKAATDFSKKVCDVLKFLNMPDVVFTADIRQGRYTKNGCDEVEFLISANEGETPKPLHKIASGGELSRTMLAIKSVLLGKDDVGTMIFDEIDTGISGFAADKVGVQLKKVAECRQVICVTHLAQIASTAHNHLLIEKSVKNCRTYTAVSNLDYEGRIKEIARIMSGTDITENLYNSAKELIDRSLNT